MTSGIITLSMLHNTEHVEHGEKLQETAQESKTGVCKAPKVGSIQARWNLQVRKALNVIVNKYPNLKRSLRCCLEKTLAYVDSLGIEGRDNVAPALENVAAASAKKSGRELVAVRLQVRPGQSLSQPVAPNNHEIKIDPRWRVEFITHGMASIVAPGPHYEARVRDLLQCVSAD